MGVCSSKTSPSISQSSPGTRVSQRRQSNGETIGPRQGNRASSEPVPPPQGPDATLVPASSVQVNESTPARILSHKPPTRSGTSNVPPVSRRPASAYATAGIGDWPASEGETSRKPLSKSDRHSRSKSFSVVAPRNSAGDGARSSKAGEHRDKSGIGIVLNRRAGPRAAVKRSATRGNNTGPLLPTVREVFPDNFRYVL
jgi:hypothetical protein